MGGLLPAHPLPSRWEVLHAAACRPPRAVERRPPPSVHAVGQPAQAACECGQPLGNDVVRRDFDLLPQPSDRAPPRARPRPGRGAMAAVGVERAALLGHVDGAALAILFAATYPERVFALVLFQGKPRFVRAPDFPWAPTRQQYEVATQAWLAELQSSADLERA